ncbi:hypothetical protein [Halorubrum vacuolatum]|uniref:Uncharacterized protein n=1 Tax=Halorubrum vacuolatum TaxID=63740 RepID=A0A238VDK8_HALVU|nr:hypothetical protein [Halorubrum vacuolatum]SNR32238.1 hypothetical protein SAMN06264855_102286 [Halorubrum vacuolatum]
MTGGEGGSDDGVRSEPSGARDVTTKDVEPSDIGPMGAMIAVAFTGAVIAFLGFGLSVFVGDAALVFAVLGLVVVLASPVAYIRFRDLVAG